MANILPDKPSTTPTTHYKAGIPTIEATADSSQYTARDLRSSLSEFTASARELGPEAPAIEQLNWLLAAARRLNEVGGMERILDTLLQSTMELTNTERGYVFIQDQDKMQFKRGLSSDGAILAEDATVSRRAINRAIASKSSFSIADTLSDGQASEWSSIVSNKIRSIYCIPLRKRVATNEPGDLLGLLYLDSRFGPSPMSEVDHRVLGMIAAEAASLLHNALLTEAELKARQAREELAVAASIHSGLMSIALPALPYAEIQARSIPCLSIGGDFYDAVALENCVSIAIADVSGKGVPAAIVAATLQGIIHAQLLSGQSLPAIAALVN
jgi:hypothetical protein